MAEKPGIIIIEGHPVMRDALADFLGGTGRWRITGKASSLASAKELLTRPGIKPDIMLLDIRLEDGWGLDIIPWYTKQKSGRVPYMAVYSAFDDYAHVSAALSMGVRAYIHKRRNERELESVLLKVLGGGFHIDEIVQARHQLVMDIFNLLTKREAEILSLVKDGLSNKQIAAALGRSHRTVENIISCIYDKTGIRSRTELERL